MRSLRAPRWVVATAVAVAAVAVVAQPAGARHGQLEGMRLNLFAGATATLSVAAPFYISHGNVAAETMEEWAALDALGKQNFLDDACTRFELTARGVPVELERGLHRTAGETAAGVPYDSMAKFHFVEYEANAFTVGEVVTFTGSWYGDANGDGSCELYFSLTTVVTFTA